MEQKQLINDWTLFKKGVANFDESRFLTLLHCKLSDYELRDVFSNLPEGENLMNNYISLFEPFYKKEYNFFPVSENRIGQIEAVSLVNTSFNAKKKIITKVKDLELIELFEKIDFKFRIVDTLEFNNVLYSDIDDLPETWVNEIVGDYLSLKKKYEEPFFYGLKEAFYGLTSDLQMVWYLMSSLFDSDYDSKTYFMIWKGGWDYLITKNEVLITQIK